jgi:hypothetical protein
MPVCAGLQKERQVLVAGHLSQLHSRNKNRTISTAVSYCSINIFPAYLIVIQAAKKLGLLVGKIVCHDAVRLWAERVIRATVIQQPVGVENVVVQDVVVMR